LSIAAALSKLVLSAPLDFWFVLAISALVQIAVFRRILLGVVHGIKQHHLNTKILALLSSSLLYAVGTYLRDGWLLVYSSVVILIFEFEWLLTARVIRRISETFRKMLMLHPRKAVVLREGKEFEVPISELQTGEIILVKPHTMVPADAIVIEGSSTVDESNVTAEGIPVEKKVGFEVFAGTNNQEGTLKCRVTAVGESTLLGQITSSVQHVQNSRGILIESAERAGVILSAFTFLISAMLLLTPIILPKFIPGSNVVTTDAFRAVASLLLASCPFISAISVSLAVSCSFNRAAGEGIIFKHESALEKLSRANFVVLDKTGTLTKGKPEITDIIPFVKSDGRFGSRSDEKQIIEYAAIAEKSSSHVIANSILRMAEEENISVSSPYFYEEIAGEGIVAKYSLKTILLGNRKLMARHSVSLGEEQEELINRLEGDGKTVLILAVDKKPFGLIAFADAIRENALEVVSELQKLKKRVVMLTGDNRNTAFAVGKKIGIYDIISDVLPKDKAEEIDKLKADGSVVVMVGDGINDAPALSRADVGIAFGSKVRPNVQAGQVVILKSDLKKVLFVIKFSDAVVKSSNAKIALSIAYHILLALGILTAYLTFGAVLNPLLAALLCAFYSLIMMHSSLAFLSYKFKSVARVRKK
ncbi:MAG: cation-translocating P-type ATPase, partial [Candidatus Micrarchaeia archaeon]